MKTTLLSLKTVGMLLVGTLFLAGCTHQQQTPVPQPADEAMMIKTEPADATSGSEGEMTEADFTIDMGMFYFEPNVLEVEAGQTVTVKLTNAEGLHDFVIDELAVASEQITAGEETTFTFTIPADAAGKEYEFYCSVMNHREKGMVGTLRVR